MKVVRTRFDLDWSVPLPLQPPVGVRRPLVQPKLVLVEDDDAGVEDEVVEPEDGTLWWRFIKLSSSIKLDDVGDDTINE